MDAALLLAKTLVPEPLRPGWSDALAMSATLIPHRRLLDIDARLEQAAAKPVIVPETIGIDHGKVFVSDTFLTACRSLGISVQPSRPATPTDNAGLGTRCAYRRVDHCSDHPAGQERRTDHQAPQPRCCRRTAGRLRHSSPGGHPEDTRRRVRPVPRYPAGTPHEPPGPDHQRRL